MADTPSEDDVFDAEPRTGGARVADALARALLALVRRMTTIDVKLRAVAPVAWPARCSGCADALADRTWTLRTPRASRVGALAGVALFCGPIWLALAPNVLAHRFDVPVCPRCHVRWRRLRRRARIVPIAVMIVLLLAGLALARWVVGHFPMPWMGTVATAAAVLPAIGVALVVGVLLEEEIRVRDDRGTLVFSFRSHAAAAQFAAANDTAVEPEDEDVVVLAETLRADL